MIGIRDRRPKDWYWNQKLLIDHFGPLIGVNGVAVYNVLSCHANGNSQQTYISVTRIAELLDTSTSTVNRALRLLKQYRLVHVTQNIKGDQHNLFTLLDLSKSAASSTPKLFEEFPTPVTSDRGAYKSSENPSKNAAVSCTPVTSDSSTDQLLVSPVTPVKSDPCQRQGYTPVKTAYRNKEEQDEVTRLNTTSSDFDHSPILKSMLRWLPSVDQDLIERLVRDCLNEAPDASAQDIAFFVEQKGPGLYLEKPTADGFRREPRADIRSPGGFLVAAVRKCFRGEAYHDYRKWVDRESQSSA